jgi:hypothetical protein
MTMTQPDDDLEDQLPDAPRDPLLDTVESLQLGTPEEAGQKLLQLLDVRDQHRATQAAFAAEDQRSQTAQREFGERNPKIKTDPQLRAAIEAAMYGEQMADLRRLGFDEKAANEQLAKAGRRGLTVADIAAEHRRLRASGAQVRSAEKLLDDATGAVEENFGRSFRTPRNASEAVRARQAHSRELRGLEQPVAGAEEPSMEDDSMSPAAFTRMAMGDVGSQQEPAQPGQSGPQYVELDARQRRLFGLDAGDDTAKRSSVVEGMRDQRRVLRGGPAHLLRKE